MSYARFFEAGSDVHVYASNERLICSGCRISSRARYETYNQEHMLLHLFMHRYVGDTVPQKAIGRLRAEILGLPYPTDVQRTVPRQQVRVHHDWRTDRVRMVDEVVASADFL